MYNKLFSKILDSSLWMESDATRIVWITFLAAMDQDGMCEFASPLNVAHRARVSIEDAEKALAVLESPDKYSSDTDNEGRRLERVAGGWIVLNASKYREISTAANKREKTRERVRVHRARKKHEQAPQASNAPAQDCNAQSVTGNAVVTTSETEAETPLSKTASSHPDKSGKVRSGEIYALYPRKQGRASALKAIAAAHLRLVKEDSSETSMSHEDAWRFLNEAVLEYARSPLGCQIDKTKIPYPATWFNDERYLDDRSMWRHVRGHLEPRNRSQERTDRNIENMLRASGLDFFPGSRPRTPSQQRHSDGLDDILGTFPELAAARATRVVDEPIEGALDAALEAR